MASYCEGACLQANQTAAQTTVLQAMGFASSISNTHLLSLGAEGVVQERTAALAPGQRAAPRPPQAYTEVHRPLRQRRRAWRQKEEQRGRSRPGAGSVGIGRAGAAAVTVGTLGRQSVMCCRIV